MGLNKRLILSYNRSVIYAVPVKTGKFLHGGGSCWFPVGGLKGDFFFNSPAEKETPVRSALCIQSLSSPQNPFHPSVTCAHKSCLDLFTSVICCSNLTAQTFLSAMERKQKAESQKSQMGKLRHTQVRGSRKPCRLSVAWGPEIQTGFLTRLRALSQVKDAVSSAILPFGWQGSKSCSCWVLPAPLGQWKADCRVVFREDKRERERWLRRRGNSRVWLCHWVIFLLLLRFLIILHFLVKVPQFICHECLVLK